MSSLSHLQHAAEPQLHQQLGEQRQQSAVQACRQSAEQPQLQAPGSARLQQLLTLFSTADLLDMPRCANAVLDAITIVLHEPDVSIQDVLYMGYGPGAALPGTQEYTCWKHMRAACIATLLQSLGDLVTVMSSPSLL